MPTAGDETESSARDDKGERELKDLAAGFGHWRSSACHSL
jgi:hypothetical protein